MSTGTSDITGVVKKLEFRLAHPSGYDWQLEQIRYASLHEVSTPSFSWHNCLLINMAGMSPLFMFLDCSPKHKEIAKLVEKPNKHFQKANSAVLFCILQLLLSQFTNV
jgi:hypothetical protein